MGLVLLTMLVCLLLSAAIALYVAYPGRGRRLPGAIDPDRRARRRDARRSAAGRSQVSSAAPEGSG